MALLIKKKYFKPRLFVNLDVELGLSNILYQYTVSSMLIKTEVVHIL